MAKRIAIDASRAVLPIRTGTETYARELIRALADQIPEHWSVQYYVNAISDVDRDWLSASGTVRQIPAPRLWTHARLSTSLFRERPDLLFVPAHVIPALHPPSVVTIHDLGYLHQADAHPAVQRRMLDATTRWNARVARRIIAISEATRGD